MKMEQINKIKQTVDEVEVNEYLAKGYKIIKIFSCKVKQCDVEEVKPCYVMGISL